VSGTARFTVGTEVHDAPAGSLVMVPPGAPHTFANPGDEPAVLLNTFTPDLYVQYFRDLRAMVEGGGGMTPEAVGGVMARYATTPSTEYAPALDDRGAGRDARFTGCAAHKACTGSAGSCRGTRAVQNRAAQDRAAAG